MIGVEDVDALRDVNKALASPWNIDASLHFVRNDGEFEKRNARIKAIISRHGKECCICLDDDNILVEFTCHHLHYCCVQCSLKITFCPTCRFIPFEHRENPCVGYK
jgi:hypothetical protein